MLKRSASAHSTPMDRSGARRPLERRIRITRRSLAAAVRATTPTSTFTKMAKMPAHLPVRPRNAQQKKIGPPIRTALFFHFARLRTAIFAAHDGFGFGTVPPCRSYPGICEGSEEPAASAVVATEAATNVVRSSAEASFLFLT